MAIGEIEIRAMTRKDLDAVARIDYKLLGTERRDYWEAKYDMFENHSALAPLVATVERNVVGFIIGDASGWEYGIPNTVGWIDTIGVDPDFQMKGIGRLLLTEMVNYMKKVGVEKVYTFVNWKDWDLLKFFASLGFTRGEMVNLELRL